MNIPPGRLRSGLIRGTIVRQKEKTQAQPAEWRYMFGESLWGAAVMTFVTAMVPVIELRGAIPAGAAAGLPVWTATVIAIAGNMVPIPFLLLLLRKIFAWLRRFRRLGEKIAWLERRAHLKGRTVRKYRTLGLIILVGIPLPGTGAWTGALVADVLDIRMKTALPAIFAGVCIAGILVALVTTGVVRLF